MLTVRSLWTTDSQLIAANATEKVRNTLGEHLIQAASPDGKDHWKIVVEMDEPSQKVTSIELQKVTAARESAEQAAARQQQESDQKAQLDKESRSGAQSRVRAEGVLG